MTIKDYMLPHPTIDRFEVIDHTKYGEGRVFVKRGMEVVLAYQDDGKTLKVFLNEVPADD